MARTWIVSTSYCGQTLEPLFKLSSREEADVWAKRLNTRAAARATWAANPEAVVFLVTPENARGQTNLLG